MCRHLGYLGPPVDLASLLLTPRHSLLDQCHAPADMRGGGTVNADGFGVGWYVPGLAAPVRYRRAVPMWSDAAFAAFAPQQRSGAVLAAVRSATAGMPVVETANAPFTADGLLFSHNGVVRGWPSSVAGLASALPTVDLITLDAPTDSALLCALLRHRVRGGADLTGAVVGLVADVAACAPGSRLNLLVTDGTVLVGSAVHHSLSVLTTRDAVLLASEPHGPHDRWTPVPDGHVVTVAPGTTPELTPIPMLDRLQETP